MYLNLDLLYNVDKYLFPLFYYGFLTLDSVGEVYCPVSKKSIYFDFDSFNKRILLYDLITCNFIDENSIIHHFDEEFEYTQEKVKFGPFTLYKYTNKQSEIKSNINTGKFEFLYNNKRLNLK